MKHINKYITEKLKIFKRDSNYTLFPKDTDELVQMIINEINQNGNECSLNHIDVSKIKDLTKVFWYDETSKFNGDISKWDVSNVKNMSSTFNGSSFNGDISDWNVSNVTDMNRMFANSYFNGDISEWNVSRVEDMTCMFRMSEFNGDISEWDVSNVTNMENMFSRSKFNGDISRWDVSKVENMGGMFQYSKFNQDISNWKINNDCSTIRIFFLCSIENKYKPKGI